MPGEGRDFYRNNGFIFLFMSKKKKLRFFTCSSLGRDLKALGAGHPDPGSDFPSTMSPFGSKGLWWGPGDKNTCLVSDLGVDIPGTCSSPMSQP